MSFSIQNYLHDRQICALIISICIVSMTLTIGFSLFLPFWISLIIAYLQQYPIDHLSQKMSYSAATVIVCLSTLCIIVIILLAGAPFLYAQSMHFIEDFPGMINKVSALIQSQSGFDLVSDERLHKIVMEQSHSLFNQALQIMVHSFPSAIHFLIYVVTIPVIVFFFNYDKDFFMKNFVALYPKNSPDLANIGRKILQQLDYYLRGKIVHMIAMGAISFLLFWMFSLNYALILSVLMGLAVFIPFVGTALATMPLILICYSQFGFGLTTLYILIGHGLIHLWNENMLVPMIFSQSNDLHPLTVIGSVLIFGNLGGVLGVFLSIPLTAIIKTLILDWPAVKAIQP